MKIGLIDVDSHHYPNFALMRIAAYHRNKGDLVEWAMPNLFGDDYDRVYASKIFTFSKDFDGVFNCEIIRGGTGYNIHSRLPDPIDQSAAMDYSIYPQYPFSVQFFSRGCIRHCPFCLVHDKEGDIHPVEPVQLNPRGQWIEVLDNNFFANPEWKFAVNYLLKKRMPVNLHGVDVRILNEEQAFYLNRLRLRQCIHIAWDLPQLDLTDKLREITRYIKPYKLMCYVLIGFNSSIEQDMFRIETLRSLGIKPYVLPFRDYDNSRTPTQYERDLAQYVNKPQIFKLIPFSEFSPRKGFRCDTYLQNLNKRNND